MLTNDLQQYVACNAYSHYVVIFAMLPNKGPEIAALLVRYNNTKPDLNPVTNHNPSLNPDPDLNHNRRFLLSLPSFRDR